MLASFVKTQKPSKHENLAVPTSFNKIELFLSILLNTSFSMFLNTSKIFTQPRILINHSLFKSMTNSLTILTFFLLTVLITPQNQPPSPPPSHPATPPSPHSQQPDIALNAPSKLSQPSNKTSSQTKPSTPADLQQHPQDPVKVSAPKDEALEGGADERETKKEVKGDNGRQNTQHGMVFQEGEVDLDYQRNEENKLRQFADKARHQNVGFSNQNLDSLVGADKVGTHEETQIEEQKQIEQENANNQQLKPWITEQIQTNVVVSDGVVMETFQVYLDPAKSFYFRWNPPKSQTLHLKVMAFEMLTDGALMVMNDNDKDECVEVSFRDEGHSTYTKLGSVYIERAFSFNFDTDFKYFRLTNNAGKGVMLIIDLERLQEVVKVEGVVHNDHFKTTVKKLQSIQEEIVSGQKLREHSYKYQWGFLDNQYAHDSRLLSLTGFELLVMIAAAIIQVYFIKSLLDNRAVV